MKKTITILGLALLMAACSNNKSGNSGSDTTKATDTTATTPAATSTTTPAAATSSADTLGKSLIAKNDCLTCHKLDQKIIGPAYDDVAKKYTASPAVIDTLANKIIKGGSGNWGTIPMTPHQSLSMTDAKEMVKYILSLK